MIKVFITGVFAFLVGLLSAPTWAGIIIEVTKGQDTGIPIAVVPFHFQGQQRPNDFLYFSLIRQRSCKLIQKVIS